MQNSLEMWSVNFKIASMDLNNYQLHRWFASISEPLNIFISTGMSTSEEVDACCNIYSVLIILLQLWLAHQVILSRLFLNLSTITYFISKFPDLRIGYSDHSAGISASQVAILKGATAIELHFTDDTRIPGPDQLISKVPDDFTSIRKFHDFYTKANGSQQKVLNPAEYFTWKTQRKSLYALSDIAKGDEISYQNTLLKSPPLGISPVVLETNKVFANSFIPKGAPITEFYLNYNG